MHRWRSAVLIGIFVAGIAARVSADQHQPNFTGEWILDLAKSELHEDYRVLEGGVVRIDHREPVFTFRRTFTVKGRSNEASYEVSTDGREHRGAAPNGAPSVSKMLWDGQALFVEQRISDPRAGELINKVRYELLDSGQTLRAIEDFDGGGRSHHNVWIYTRKTK